MSNFRIIFPIAAIVALVQFSPKVFGDNTTVIVKGTVEMRDGSPLPKSVGIEKACDDTGNAPGPGVNNKSGEYLWRMDVDPMKTRTCILRATSKGYKSSSIDISNLNGYVKDQVTLPPIILFSQTADPYVIDSSEDGVPPKADAAWRAAVKAISANKIDEAAAKMQAAVTAVPQFARGWHAIGLLDEHEGKDSDARAAYEHAIQADPNFLLAYMTLIRGCARAADWKCVATNSEALDKVDTKRVFPESSFHLAVARYEMKDLTGAETSITESIARDPRHRSPRNELVLGVILDAKGDHNGAQEHITKYIELDPKAPDADLIKARLSVPGQNWDGLNLDLF